MVWLHDTAFAAWVRESGSLWSYPGILFLHSLGMAIVVGLNWAIDFRVLGVGRRLPLEPMEQMFPLMWFGFWINAITGSMLFVADAITKSKNPVFYVKMTLIALALVDLYFMRKSVFRQGRPVGATLPASAKLLAGSSIVFWAAAITAGRAMAYLGNGR
jgi:hypothetical protein